MDAGIRAFHVGRKQETSESYRSGLLQPRVHISEADYETKAGRVTGERVKFELTELKMAPAAATKFSSALKGKMGVVSEGRIPNLGLPTDTINTDIEVITLSAQCLLSTKDY